MNITLSPSELRIADDALSQAIADWEDMANGESDRAASAHFQAMVKAAEILRARLLNAQAEGGDK